MMPEEETCFCCLRISQQKRCAEDIWLEAGTTAWVRSSRGVSRCCTDKKVHQVCWLPGSDHSMAGNLIKFFYCKYGGLSDSLPCLPSNVVSVTVHALSRACTSNVAKIAFQCAVRAIFAV